MYYNIIPVLWSQIIKEMPLHWDKSYVNKIYVSNSLSVILGDYNPHMLESNGTLTPIWNFANPQIFDHDRLYYVILGDVDDLRDGYDHYIQYVGKYTGDMKPWIYPDYSMPLYANKDWKKIVNWFQWLIIWGCTRTEAVLSYSWVWCPQFYYSDFLWVKCTSVLHLEVSKEIKIPINAIDEEEWGISKNLDDLHLFSCRFGYQGFNLENTDYTHLNDCLYVSWVILDNDPNMLDLPKDKTYFEDLD